MEGSAEITDNAGGTGAAVSSEMIGRETAGSGSEGASSGTFAVPEQPGVPHPPFSRQQA